MRAWRSKRRSPARGEQESVELTAIEPCQARADIAAQFADDKIRAQGAQLRLPAQTRGADASAAGKLIQARVMDRHKRIARVFAL